jgi:biofilm PGA synthesis N-glycosyltransferase PgaC
LLDEKALTLINRAFEDENLIAAGGTVHVLQGRKFNKGLLKPTLKVKPIVIFQIFEYLRGFYIYKASLAKADALSIISGAFGIFKKDVLLAVGGYRKTVGEDIDITLKVQNYKNKRKGLKVAYIPEAVCYTEVPETWKDFYKQRIRWQKAFVDCLILYFKELILTIFTKPLSFFFLVDAFLVGTVSSYITVLGFVLILLFFGYTKLMIILTVISLSISLIYNFVSVGISYVYKNGFLFKDFLTIFVFIMLDLFFYRFIALFCTLYGTIQYFISKDDWNKVARTGREYNIEQAG